MRELYPPIEPFRTGTLRVSELHTLYYEEVGNPAGRPVVFLHGGPGGGLDPDYRRCFDPARWRVVLFDQRGCGKSTPHAELRDNTTWTLVADIERLRERLYEKDKKMFYDEFSKLKGFTPYKSFANFILVDFPPEIRSGLKEYLSERNLIIKFLDEEAFRTEVRISLGTRKQNKLLMDTIKKYCKEINLG